MPSTATQLPDWQDPTMLQRNREPARPLLIPYADDATALAGERERSPWYRSLNGEWLFHYAESTALVPADQRGHFVASFRINGRPFEAIVDTGATAVALNMGTARRAGISVNPGDFIHEVDTANGKARAALEKIPDISIGRIVLRDVQAVVLEDRALRTNLIGMTFLQRLAKYKVEGGNLLLVQ